MVRHLVDNRGSPVILSNEIGKGGEGTVFNIQDSPSLVAKIYTKAPSLEQAEKISTMINVGNERLLKLSTWPINTIHAADKKLIGFTMPKLSGHKPIFELYSPKKRLQEFPSADWRFLIHAAINTARAFSVIHEVGHVVGDVNHGNLFVASDATVQFIDTDSFQIHSKGAYWNCEVGVPTHQPPEMQNILSYKGVMRTPNHDNFGLAVLIFQLLCLARHPFSGRYSGVGDMSIEQAIAEYRYAYAAQSSQTMMSPPPASLSMDALTSNIRLNFERAFSKEGERHGFRPTPQDWIIALTELSSKLRVCAANQGHFFYSSLKNCPWCEIEGKCNTFFFPIVGPKSNIDLNITTLWQQFLSIKPPISTSLPNIANFQQKPSTKAVQTGKSIKVNQYIIPLLFCLLIALGCAIFGPSALIALFGTNRFINFFKENDNNSIELITEELKLIKSQWLPLCTKHEALAKNFSFESLRCQILELKKKYDTLPCERDKKLEKLKQNRFEQQLTQHLDQYRLESYNIEGIGPGRLATLQSYSIETAADIDRLSLMGIGGFGPVLISRLIDWKKFCESTFVFDPSRGIPQVDILALDREMACKRSEKEKELATKISQLSFLSKEISLQRERLQTQIQTILPKYAQTLADARELGITN